MKTVQVTFSVNRYDYEGDLTERCIELHFNDCTTIRIGRNDLPKLIHNLQRIDNEISNNYPKESD